MGVGSYNCNHCLWVQALTREHPKARLIEFTYILYIHTHIHISTDVTTHELLLCSRRYEERKESFDMSK